MVTKSCVIGTSGTKKGKGGANSVCGDGVRGSLFAFSVAGKGPLTHSPNITTKLWVVCNLAVKGLHGHLFTPPLHPALPGFCQPHFFLTPELLRQWLPQTIASGSIPASCQAIVIEHQEA